MLASMTSEESEFNSLEYKRVKFVSQEFWGNFEILRRECLTRKRVESKKFGIDDIINRFQDGGISLLFSNSSNSNGFY